MPTTSHCLVARRLPTPTALSFKMIAHIISVPNDYIVNITVLKVNALFFQSRLTVFSGSVGNSLGGKFKPSAFEDGCRSCHD